MLAPRMVLINLGLSSDSDSSSISFSVADFSVVTFSVDIFSDFSDEITSEDSLLIFTELETASWPSVFTSSVTDVFTLVVSIQLININSFR